MTAVVGDVADPGDAARIITAALDRFGRLDVPVANGGVIPLMEITDADVSDWDHVMAVDGRGMFLTCKYAVAAMRDRGGAIVCVSSISGEAGQRGQAVYGPAKFVASGLTKHLAVEWADRGIRVNAVAPGTIETERLTQLRTEPGSLTYLTTDPVSFSLLSLRFRSAGGWSTMATARLISHDGPARSPPPGKA